jgi:hypothetical protein
MAFVPCHTDETTALITMYFRKTGRILQNTIHASKPGGSISDADLFGYCTTLKDWWDTTYKACANQDTSLFQVIARVLGAEPQLEHTLSVSPPIAGTKAGNTLPASVSATMSWRTGLAGRKFRGRTYAVSPTEGDLDSSDLLTSGYIARLAAAAADLVSRSPFGGNGDFVIWHCHDASLDPTLVTTAIISQLPDNQRRRLPGRGR